MVYFLDTVVLCKKKKDCQGPELCIVSCFHSSSTLSKAVSAIRLSGPVNIGSSTRPFLPRTCNRRFSDEHSEGITLYAYITASSNRGNSFRAISRSLSSRNGVLPRWDSCLLMVAGRVARSKRGCLHCFSFILPPFKVRTDIKIARFSSLLFSLHDFHTSATYSLDVLTRTSWQ